MRNLDDKEKRLLDRRNDRRTISSQRRRNMAINLRSEVGRSPAPLIRDVRPLRETRGYSY